VAHIKSFLLHTVYHQLFYNDEQWNYEKTLEFIEMYHNKPVLWDQKNPNYYNKYTKNDAWEELATEIIDHLCSEFFFCTGTMILYNLIQM